MDPYYTDCIIYAMNGNIGSVACLETRRHIKTRERAEMRFRALVEHVVNLLIATTQLFSDKDNTLLGASSTVIYPFHVKNLKFTEEQRWAHINEDYIVLVYFSARYYVIDDNRKEIEQQKNENFKVSQIVVLRTVRYSLETELEILANVTLESVNTQSKHGV